jgi:hypothetical protein
VLNAERMWDANERLLQSYRLIFISSQSFMLAVGALFWGKSLFVLVATALISLGIVWGVWVPVVFARHRIVDYYKHASRLTEPQRQQLCSEAEYVSNARSRGQANELLNIRNNLGITRIKIDIVIPAAITLVWVIFVTSAYLAR